MASDKSLKLIGQIEELLKELKAQVTGEVPDAVKLGKRALETWCKLWANEYHEDYLPNYATHKPQIKRFLLGGVTIERLEEKMAAFLLDKDPYLVRNRHPFLMFVKQFNSIRTSEHQPSAAPRPIGCRHLPTCKDDIEHTRRSTQDLRSGRA